MAPKPMWMVRAGAGAAAISDFHDKGLYVSTRGFSKEARYEADRSAIPLTLMDLDDLAREISDHYEKMDSEARALIPLTRIYWPT